MSVIYCIDQTGQRMTVIDLFFQQIDFIEEYYQRNVFQIAVRESEELNMNPRTYIVCKWVWSLNYTQHLTATFCWQTSLLLLFYQLPQWFRPSRTGNGKRDDSVGSTIRHKQWGERNCAPWTAKVLGNS